MITKNNWQDIELYIESFPNLDAELLQLSKGTFDTSCFSYVSNTLTIDRRLTKAKHIHKSNVELNTINIIFTKNTLSECITVNNLELTGSNQLILMSGEEVFSLLPENFDILTLTLDLRTLSSFMDLDFSLYCPNQIRKAEINISKKFELQKKVETIFKIIESKSNLTTTVEQDIHNTLYLATANYFLDMIPLKTKEKVRTKAQIKTRIIRCLYELTIDELNVTSLAKNSFISVRSLYQYCHLFFNLTPNQLIVKTRLNRAHKILSLAQNEKTLISEVMELCGVTNVSRFNQAYEHIFGELPKNTLSKTKSRLK